MTAYLGPDGPLFFFPLGRPAPWRLITMRAPTATGPVMLEELQAEIDRATGGSVRVHDPVWTSAFRVHHRSATQYRRGRVLVAGDAAHVHSPAGAQGMNTGIQDAVNLGWKLALVCTGVSGEALLDSYDAERRPVGEFVLRFTDRAFSVVTSRHPWVRAVRTHVVPRVLPLALRFRAGRRVAFRTVSQLGISYRGSPLVQPGSRWSRGPRAGDRLPDAAVTRAGQELSLQEALSAPAFHLLLCGPADRWDDAATDGLRVRHGALLRVHRLVPADQRGRAHETDLVDASGIARQRLGARRVGHLVVRPDGHVGYRSEHADLAGATAYLSRWLQPTAQSVRSGVGVNDGETLAAAHEPAVDRRRQDEGDGEGEGE